MGYKMIEVLVCSNTHVRTCFAGETVRLCFVTLVITLQFI